VGVSFHSFSFVMTPAHGVLFTCSVPAALQFEKFNMPDEIRILDGIIETLSY